MAYLHPKYSGATVDTLAAPRRLLLLGLLVCSSALASPTSVAWQGRFTDVSGVGLEGTHTVTLTLYDSNDSAIWRRAYTGQDFHGGYVSLHLDGAGSVGGVLDTSHFAETTFVGVQLDGATELSPRQALTAVPRAATAEAMAGVLPTLGTTAVCTVDTVGTLRFDTGRLEICSGGAWKLIVDTHPTDKHLVISGTGARTWSDSTQAQSCEQYRHPASGAQYGGETGSGRYAITSPRFASYDVHCDRDFEGGGWTLVGRGIGGAAAGWKDTTTDLNITDAVDGLLTFKSSDARITAIPKSVYRLVGFGEFHQDRYWSATTCPT
ncbi:MAG: hypothetical protein ACJATT_002061 [Myxococcota bacterium]|jgi:hypothetical protein